MLDRSPSLSPTAFVFDPWLTCSHPEVLARGDSVLADWSNGIDLQRARRLKAADRHNRAAMVRTIFANIAISVVRARGSDAMPCFGLGLRAFRQQTTRYDRPGFRGLPEVFNLMEASEVLTVNRSDIKGRVSKIVPSASVVAALQRCGLSWCDFAQQAGRESIVLSRKGSDDDEEDWPPRHAEKLDYPDTNTSRRFRAEMEKINAFLTTADMCFVDNGDAPVATHARSLRRYFRHPPGEPVDCRPRFDLGGRLFGGGSTPAWWSDLAKHRRANIRLQGEPIADLDFASMFLRLAYIEAGLAPPDGDLYDGVHGDCGVCWRPGVKKVALAMLFRTKPLTRLPKGSAAHLPPGTNAFQLRSAIIERHPALVDVFETGIGMRLMFVESQVLVSAMLRLVDAGIVALPMHDGLMVPQSKAEMVGRIMSEAARAESGYALPITRKDGFV